MKRFLAAPLITLLLLGGLWVTGLDSIFIKENRTYEENIRKYNQVQRLILDHHVDPQTVDVLFKSSMRGFVESLSDSLMSIQGTPLDTLFEGVTITTMRDAVLLSNAPIGIWKPRTRMKTWTRVPTTPLRPSSHH